MPPKDLLKESLHAVVSSDQLCSTATRALWLSLTCTPTTLAAWLTDLTMLIIQMVPKFLVYLVTHFTLDNLQGRFQLVEANRTFGTSDTRPTLLHLNQIELQIQIHKNKYIVSPPESSSPVSPPSSGSSSPVPPPS